MDPNSYALLILAIGIITVLGMILVLRVNAFLALLTAAIIVSLMAPGAIDQKISRVASAFGDSAGKIAIVIALAAIIGECMMRSGAADRIVQAFLRVLGVERAPWALMSSGFFLAVPVFFDTVFYLLVPLARSLYRKTHQNYLLSILAIAAGGAITHTLVPPTPGPLLMAANLNIDVGVMILVGGMVAIPAAVGGLTVSRFLDRKLEIPYRETAAMDGTTEPKAEEVPASTDDANLPALWLSVLPVILPVLLISANTALDTLAKSNTSYDTAAQYSALFGNANFALFLSTIFAMYLLWQQKRPTLSEMSRIVEYSLMSAGIIILITAGGGAFGAMLKAAQVGDAIQDMVPQGASGAAMFMLLGYGIAVLLKIAQGSSTVAMITGSSMLAAMIPESLTIHPVFLATSIGAGSLMGSWMNDSGFWIFAKMGGLTEAEALKSWTIMLAVLSIVSFLMSALLAMVIPAGWLA